MARIDAIDARLWRWAEWLKCGDGSGYPVKSTLHEDWSPPSPGMRPSMKVSAGSDGPQTQRVVLLLSERLRATLVAHYVLRMSPIEAAEVLQCKPGTVHQRIEVGHRELAKLLAECERGRAFCNVAL